MLRSGRQILSLFSKKERWHLGGVGLAMLAMGFMQMLGVGIILPFVSLLSNPEHIQDSAILSTFYQLFGFETNRAFLLFLGALLLITLVTSNAVSALTLWLMTHFTWRVQQRISAKLLSGYLNQPYEAFLNRNSADIGKNILTESQQFTTGVLMSALKVAAYGTNALLIVGFLVWINPWVAISVAIIFLLAYMLVYMTVRRVLLRIGKRRMSANTARFKAVNEAFGSVKEVKVLGREDSFLNRYIPAAGDFAVSNASNQVLNQIPRFAIEALAFGIVMGAMLYVLAAGYPMQSVLPVASAFVVAGYRLLPALQNIYGGIATLRFNQSVIDTLQRDLRSYVAPASMSNSEPVPSRANGPMTFSDKVTLDAVGYTYPGAPTASLSNVTISIPRNSFVALTGSTGAGKTTLADIILGLLQPTEGALWVDDKQLTPENIGSWQANIGYVPQDIYLTDNTVAANIAYGIEPSEIDREALENAARIANIHDFIIDKLPEGFDTMVGERGVRLSGGQRQRIGIARALYHNPQVIVLDEATSALDNETERRIVDELDAMRGGRTLIVIAHRLTTVQKCHKVFMLHEGEVVADGSYDELVRDNTEFGRLALAANDGR